MLTNWGTTLDPCTYWSNHKCSKGVPNNVSTKQGETLLPRSSHVRVTFTLNMLPGAAAGSQLWLCHSCGQLLLVFPWYSVTATWNIKKHRRATIRRVGYIPPYILIDSSLIFVVYSHFFLVLIKHDYPSNNNGWWVAYPMTSLTRSQILPYFPIPMYAPCMVYSPSKLAEFVQANCMTGWVCSGKCWEIFHHHGASGYHEWY